MRDTIGVPAQLLLAPDLSASAKLIWLLAHLHHDPGTAGPALIETAGGLSRHTVLKGLRELASNGWSPSASTKHHRTVQIPTSLLTDRRVSPYGRLLYGYLQLLPTFKDPRGNFTSDSLGTAAGASPRTVRRGIAELRNAGWLEVDQEHRLAPIGFRLTHTGAVELLQAVERLDGIKPRGEALMRECLSLLINSTNFQENATPSFLINPHTDHNLEIDRYYAEWKVGFECNGPQHDGPTELFPEEVSLRQQGRDLIKEALCARNGVTLIIIRPEDLSLKTISEKIPAKLPRRDLIGHEPLMKFLENKCTGYRHSARGWRTTAPQAAPRHQRATP